MCIIYGNHLEESCLSVYRIARTALMLCCFAMGSAWASSSLFSLGNEPEFLDPAEVFTLEPVQQQGDEYVVQGRVADRYYVYRHSLRLVDAHETAVKLADRKRVV